MNKFKNLFIIIHMNYEQYDGYYILKWICSIVLLCYCWDTSGQLAWYMLSNLLLMLCSLCVIFMILDSIENVKKCALGGCTITSKAKINVVWNFFLAPLEPLRSKKFQTTLILAFEANSALPRENETKDVKITHSAMLCLFRLGLSQTF